MYQFKNLFLLIVLLSAMGSASAQQSTNQVLNINGLTYEQQQELEFLTQQFQLANDAVYLPEEVTRLKMIGQSIGVAFTAFASELGVNPLELSSMDIGKEGYAIIVWKVVGPGIVGIFLSLFILLVGVPLWIYLFRRMCVIKSIEYADGKKRLVTHHGEGSVDGTRIIMMIAIAALLLAAAFAGLGPLYK